MRQEELNLKLQREHIVKMNPNIVSDITFYDKVSLAGVENILILSRRVDIRDQLSIGRDQIYFITSETGEELSLYACNQEKMRVRSSEENPEVSSHA